MTKSTASDCPVYLYAGERQHPIWNWKAEAKWKWGKFDAVDALVFGTVRDSTSNFQGPCRAALQQITCFDTVFFMIIHSLSNLLSHFAFSLLYKAYHLSSLELTILDCSYRTQLRSPASELRLQLSFVAAPLPLKASLIEHQTSLQPTSPYPGHLNHGNRPVSSKVARRQDGVSIKQWPIHQLGR